MDCVNESTSSSKCFACQILCLKPTRFAASCTATWIARKQWVNKDGTPNFDYLRKTYGNEKCPISSNDGTNELSFSNYIDYCQAITTPENERYLKDWHYQKKHGITVYSPPLPLQTDWINREKWTNDDQNPFGGDYRFVYIGRKGTWTRFHSDVLATHSWSANVCGRKLWYFVPPGQERFFMKHGVLVEDIRDHEELWTEAGVIEVIQEPGELFFVPSNWHHQVHNLENTISINHNFVNASNVHLMYEFLTQRLSDIEKSLEGVIGFTEQEIQEQYQKILLADTRLDFTRFRRFLQMIQEDRSYGYSQCYVCSQHLHEYQKCFFNPLCIARFSQICDCQLISDGCSICQKFLSALDLTASSILLSKMSKLEKSPSYFHTDMI